jgi:hypothetical protein
LRDGIMLEHLSSLMPDEPLMLRSVVFLDSGESAPVRALPSERAGSTP